MTRAWNGLARPAFESSRLRLAALAALLASLAFPTPAPAQARDGDDGLPTVSRKTAGLERRDGLLPLWIDRRAGKVWLEVPAPEDAANGGERGAVGSYLYVEGLVTGLGSNPVGLDRGQLGETRVVTLRWVGNRLLLEAQNLRYRALTENPLEARAVDQSFADSVLWGGELAALESRRALVDFTSFVVRDAHDVAAALRRSGQGAYALDPDRSAADLDACLAFPDNLELEALLTYAAAGEPGGEVEAAAAVPQAFSVVQHHSLLRLPDPEYEPRELHPRSGSFAVEFTDYAAPLDAPTGKLWLVRHRLEPGDTLTYYVDPGAPEPVRSALVEGASWWAEAFAAAGFPGAFRVELLPQDAHPLDARYNVIQWVHRATRGWSYGGGVLDPRTGEMVKGHVTLGSLRIRQDRLIFEGLAGTEATGTGAPDDPVELALARIRQLSAHEVGHTLGLAHNFAASTYGRESVMDYPAPLVGVGPDGALDFSEAYDTGVGAWDVQAIRYAYTPVPPGEDEEAVLGAILEENRERGLIFLTDQDARPPGAAHPLANLWDNFADPVAGLEAAVAVRRAALAGFGVGNVPPGEPLT
ncbi:MAG TPA: zinc-dependent metalloprotease, partial [Thermoanaerobaculia bacterium]|nr:zinc-dependent metalloprotease [Thermoanaerobaculia bacterium]